MAATNEKPFVHRRVHLQGIALVAFALVAGVIVAYGEVRGSTGYPNAVVAPLAGLGSHPENYGMPRPATGLVATSSNQGQVLFGRYCDSCHPGGNAGVGASLRDAQFKQQYTTTDQIIKVVRNGGFDMPAFPTTLLPDDKLQLITEYVLKLPQAGQ